MATLWGGRFTKETGQEVFDFNASFSFDQRLLEEDIEGSLAHARMLGRQGIIEEAAAERIRQGLEEIRNAVREGQLQPEGHYEDVHSFVEDQLIQRIGEDGKRLHTGRSRNDQVAVDTRLFARKALDDLSEKTVDLLKVLLSLMEEHKETVMPGFTHLQKAQPTTLAHHLGAYFEMFRRDYLRFRDCRERLTECCPLGAGAFAGTTYPLDRQGTAEALGFVRPAANSMDAVSDRDYLLEALSDLSILMMHLSRFAEEIILWNSNDVGFVELDDGFCTGSSIMPQKKNPDVAELVRGKTGRVYGDLLSLLTTMKGLPLAYNKDMQEDKEPFFDAYDTAADCLSLFAGMLLTTRFRKERMEMSAGAGFTNATDAADYLVGKGIPFRDAHEVVGRMVLLCLEKDKGISELTREELAELSPVFGEDFYQAVALSTCVEKRNTTGAPGGKAMEEEIRQCRAFLEGI